MIILEDTRQQKDKHTLKNEFWASHDDTVIRSKLPWGDYCLAPAVAVDTKADIIEIAQNMCGSVSEKRRFTKEVKSARDAGCMLWFLIEDARYQQISDLYGETIQLHNGQTIKGDQLARAMEVMTARYNCRFKFCLPENAGYIVKKILCNE